VNVIDAMEDEALVGRDFGGASWSAWRLLLRALFGLLMSDEGRELQGAPSTPSPRCDK
jgi:hypothetical protein